MCSPELTKGMCCICCGTLTPENTLYDDLHEGRGGVHRGKCAILAGLGMTPEQNDLADDIIHHAHQTEPNSPERRRWDRVYYAFVDAIATEDHYWDGAPPGTPEGWTFDTSQPEPTWLSDDGRWLIRHRAGNSNNVYHLIDRASEPSMSRGAYSSFEEAAERCSAGKGKR